MVPFFDKTQTVDKANALPGRTTPMPVATLNVVTHHSMTQVPEGMEVAIFAMGCFWGVERLFWQQQGVYSTAAGYSGGFTPNPTYREVCSGQTGHTEVVRVVFDPKIISYKQLLQVFWENHDPAQGMRQGGDVGTQYRSAIYTLTPEQQTAAESSLKRFQQAMNEAGDQRTITPKWCRRCRFTMPRMTISSICTRILKATAAWAASAFVCHPRAKPLVSGNFLTAGGPCRAAAILCGPHLRPDSLLSGCYHYFFYNVLPFLKSAVIPSARMDRLC